MNVKEAVNVAKVYVSDLFTDEQIIDLGLEEVEFDDSHKIWNVTVGFSRPWSNKNVLSALTNGVKRDYKVVKISDANAKVLSVLTLRGGSSWRKLHKGMDSSTTPELYA